VPTSERYPSIPDLPRMVPAKNANGEIQRIPSRWLDHPTLGRGFTLTPSFRAAMQRQEDPTTAASTGETAPDDVAPATESAAATADPTPTRRKTARTATKEA